MAKKKNRNKPRSSAASKAAPRRASTPQNRWLVPLLVTTLGFLSRIIHLEALPLFNDEAILLGWSKSISPSLSQNLFYTVRADGHLPLVTWLQVFSFKFFADPVFAGRFISVLTGTLSAVGVYFIGQYLFSQRVGTIAALLYIFSPMAFFNDRFAYFDSPMSFFGVYTMLFTVLLLVGEEKRTAFYWSGLGISMALAVLSKTAAFMILLFPVLVFFLIPKKPSSSKLKLFITVYVFPVVSYFWLFSQPSSQMIFKKGTDMSMGITKLLGFPVTQWKTNLVAVGLNWWYYLTFPLIIILIIATYRLIKEKQGIGWFLLLSFLLPSVFFTTVAAGHIFFKYLFFTFPPVLVLIASSIDWLAETVLGSLRSRFPQVLEDLRTEHLIAGLLALILIPSLRFDYYMLTDPSRASFTAQDRSTHITSDNSGYGLNETADFIKKESDKGPIVLFLPHPDVGLLHFGLPLLVDVQRYPIYMYRLDWNQYGSSPTGDRFPANLIDLVKPNLTGNERIFAVCRDGLLFKKLNPEAVLVHKTSRPDNYPGILVYELPY